MRVLAHHDATGGERYLAERMENDDYREAYNAAMTGVWWCKRRDGRLIEHAARTDGLAGHTGHVHCVVVGG